MTPLILHRRSNCAFFSATVIARAGGARRVGLAAAASTAVVKMHAPAASAATDKTAEWMAFIGRLLAVAPSEQSHPSLRAGLWRGTQWKGVRGPDRGQSPNSVQGHSGADPDL